MINRHLVPFDYKGKKYVKNTDTGKVMLVAGISLPTLNEMESIQAYPPNGIRLKDMFEDLNDFMVDQHAPQK